MSTSRCLSLDTTTVCMLAGGLLFLSAVMIGGCASKPKLTQSGFLSDYSRLDEVDSDRMRYQSPEADRYRRFIVEPVQILVPAGVFTTDEQAEISRYFAESFERAITDAGYQVTDTPGVGVGRVRLALTDVAESTWWKKIHPAARAIGAGTGGGAMEAELVDSVTGEQIVAVIQAGTGNQFRLTNFSTMADVKSTIDGWARIAAQRLEALSASQAGGS